MYSLCEEHGRYWHHDPWKPVCPKCQPEVDHQIPTPPEPPRHWTDKTSDLMMPIVRRFVEGEELNEYELQMMRMYCEQWVDSKTWDSNPFGGLADLAVLRKSAREIDTLVALRKWIEYATELGMNPH